MSKKVGTAVSAVVLLGALAFGAMAVAGVHVDQHRSEPDAGIRIDDSRSGAPLAGASVRWGGSTLTTDADGLVALPGHAAGLARISAPGHLRRVVAVDPGTLTEVALQPARPGTVSLRFGGDVMMGRRFYRPGDGTTPLLGPGASVADHAALLDGVRPLLEDGDLTVVNLETALVAHPYLGGPRRGVNATKDLVVTSAPETAAALKRSGVDVVDLANNHVYDGLGAGLRTTLRSVARAGLARFGAGRTVAAAWRPALVRTHGQTVAFVGCTTVTGDDERTSYVATARHGGAARCEAGRLRAALRAASRKADEVVFMLHGGVEYQRTQDPTVRSFDRLAARAGADVIVDGHPHVIGGVRRIGAVPVIESMGNLVFDQDLWETFVGYLARVDLRGGRAVDTTVDPIAMEHYRPVPTVGALADAADRIAAGTLPRSVSVGRIRAARPGRASSLAGTAGEIASVPAGASPGPGVGYRLGRDLLFGTGGMEPDEVRDPDAPAPPLWALGRFADATPDAACTGTEGLRLQRSPVSRRDVVAGPSHRVAVTPGQALTLSALVRQASPGSTIEIRWYRGFAGSSAARSALPVPERSPYAAGCAPLRLDVTVPRRVVAAEVYVRLRPSHDVNFARTVMLDDIRLTTWERPGRGGVADDVVGFDDDATVPLRR